MIERLYAVSVDNKIVATDMPIEYAMILVKAVFAEYYNDHDIAISITEVGNRMRLQDDIEKEFL